jgi:type II secretory pathway pseudopilin PulG
MATAGLVLGYITFSFIPLGIIAAIAIPAFMGARVKAQEAAVLNNARQLLTASEQHYMDSGASTASRKDLVGATKYIKELRYIERERYPDFFTQGQPVIVRDLPGGRIVTCSP